MAIEQYLEKQKNGSFGEKKQLECFFSENKAFKGNKKGFFNSIHDLRGKFKAKFSENDAFY